MQLCSCTRGRPRQCVPWVVIIVYLVQLYHVLKLTTPIFNNERTLCIVSRTGSCVWLLLGALNVVHSLFLILTIPVVQDKLQGRRRISSPVRRDMDCSSNTDTTYAKGRWFSFGVHVTLLQPEILFTHTPECDHTVVYLTL